MKLLRPGILLFILIAATSYGQITINSGDLLNLIGENHEVESDGSGSLITVDVGSSGPNQTWDLSGISFVDPLQLSLNYVSPGDTPFADSFPMANIAYSIPFEEFGYTGTGYNYIQVLSNKVVNLGFAAAISDPDSSIIDFSDEEVVQLPLAYGDSWTSTNIDTFEFIPGYGTITIDNTHSTVDGWGKIKLKAGEFDCLRLRDDSEEITLTLIGGEAIFADTSNTINYNWIGKESVLLAEIESLNGEENPNFTEAEYVQVTSSVNGPSALVQDGQTILPRDLALHTNYPNPFNPSTTIRFDIPQTGNVELAIFDLNGRRIATLVDGAVAAGNHQISWNGRSASGAEVASGVYIYRLQHMENTMSRKLTLLR